MRKLIVIVVLAVLFIVPISVFAQNSQIDAKSIEFGLGTVFGITLWRGELFEGSEERDISIGTGAVALNAGYFVINGLSVGGSVSYFNSKIEGVTDPGVLLTISPVVKYYFPISDKFLVNAKALFEYNSMKLFVPEAFTYFAVGGGGAATYLLNDNLGIYGGFDFVHGFNQKFDGTEIDNSSRNIIDIGVGLTIFI